VALVTAALAVFATSTAPASAAPAILDDTLGVNPGFEAGGIGWNVFANLPTNFVVYSSGQVPGESARSGSRYAALNTATVGGGVYQNIAFRPTAGSEFCASTWVRTQAPQEGASGQFVIWLLGGAFVESRAVSFSGLSNGSDWRQIEACVTAATAHTSIRVQLFPTPGSPTVQLDDVVIQRSLLANGGFDLGGTGWRQESGTLTNFVVYQDGARPNERSHSGPGYAATNTISSSGGIAQDAVLSSAPGSQFCATAWVRTQHPLTGASGSFIFSLRGGQFTESRTVVFNNLGNGTNWRRLESCIAPRTFHTSLRVQFRPAATGTTLQIDDVRVRRSLAPNGGFEVAYLGWPAYPGTNTNAVSYATGQVPNESAHSGLRYLATTTGSPGGGVYQDFLVDVGPGSLYCASAYVRTQSPLTGASGQFVVWLLGGDFTEFEVVNFNDLRNRSNWRRLELCLAPTTRHTVMRMQFYPTPFSPPLEIDDVRLDQLTNFDGGFDAGGRDWQVYPASGTNYVVHKSGDVAGRTARSGVRYAAVSTSAPAGGIFQDISIDVAPGDRYCASTFVRTQAPATGASGSFAVFLLGGEPTIEGTSVAFSGLGNNDWRRVEACVTAKGFHTTMRLEFYPQIGGPVLEADDVTVNRDLT
jgi:hypothetical protein